PYSPPTAGREGKLRLDFNENTVGCSPRGVQALKRLTTGERLAVYPEYGEAKPKLAAFFGIPESELLFTNGTDEAIQVVVNTYIENDARVLLLKPSYAMYRFYADVGGARIDEVAYRPGDLSFPL